MNQEPKKIYEEDMKFVARCIANEKAAWDSFYKEYKIICIGITRSCNLLHEFDELFSDFILKLTGTTSGKDGLLGKYNGRSKLKTFLSFAFNHLIIDHQRKKYKKRSVQIVTGMDEDLANVPEDNDDEKEVQEKVMNAVKQLPSEDFKFVELYYYNGQKLQQIADTLGCNVSTVSRRLKTIQKKLKEML